MDSRREARVVGLGLAGVYIICLLLAAVSMP
jgi:hypothetical protein